MGDRTEEQMSTTISEQDNKDVNELIDHLTLFDDDLMSRVFDKNTEATELILQQDLDNMYYDAFAQGVKHFKETEKGRDQMCEAVEKYARNYADKKVMKSQVTNVQNLMENMKLTLEQALDAMGIQGDERVLITEQLQN